MSIPDVLFTRTEPFHMLDELPLQSIVHHGQDMIHHINDMFDYNIVDYIEIYQINIGDGSIMSRVRANLTHYNIYHIDNVLDGDWYYHVRFLDFTNNNINLYDNNTVNRLTNTFNEHVTGTTLGVGNRIGTIVPMPIMQNLPNINIIY